MLTGFDLCRAAVAVEGISAPEQSVLMVLAIMADKQAQCWPSVAMLVAKTKLSERAVQNAVKALALAGHMTRTERPGRGVIYSLHPRIVCTPAQDAPVQDVRPAGDAPTPAPPAPNQPRTTKPKKERERGSRVPINFAPEPASGSITAAVMAEWPPGTLAEQVEHFVDHHTTHGTLSLDWQASWRTWVKNWKRFNGQRANHHQRRGTGNHRSTEMADAYRDLGFG
ncbi:helix-turn-helix domain-containing protein [Sphingomonas sp. RHCKR47]|uniref:helix-turn-helix domain-containing protein n=1 Tax=Sphingomonas citricola TaxID=2862498 RepID=UPI001C66D464|nr:helix-turn-helix domain-containing protein [Sphingomonas citricola]MBW6523453.1 helix-turn-helix domain-containing protein [Sphingomonas citricola]